MATSTAAQYVTGLLEWTKKAQFGHLVRKHLPALLLGACIATVIIIGVGWTQRDARKEVRERGIHLDSPSSMSGGAMYTRWGRKECPGDDTTLVYAGYAAGSHYTHTGSGANHLCLPDQPQWDVKDDAVHDLGLIYGVEYELSTPLPFDSSNAAGGTRLMDHNVPCAVCLSKVRMTSLMIPAMKTCPAGWVLEYSGYVMSSHYTQQRSEYICVDRAPEADDAGYRNEDGALLYPVEGKCGSLPCPPYVEGWELSCVVCTR